MNTKFKLTSIIFTFFIIAAACSSSSSSMPILDQAPTDRLYKSVPSLPVTGASEVVRQAYDFEQEARAYPSHQVHSACASEDIQRQGDCEEREQTGVTLLRIDRNTEEPASPIQKLHSHCVSADADRYHNCME